MFKKSAIKYLLTIIFSVMFFGVFAFINTTTAFAQEAPLDITASPAFFDFSSKPESIITDKIRMRNNTVSPVTLKVGFKKLSSGGLNEVSISDITEQDDFVKWITLDKTVVEIKPREFEDIPFSINIPAEGFAGYYFAFTFIPVANKDQIDVPTAVIQGELAVPILLKVDSPNAKVIGNLIEFSTKNFINEYLPINFLTVFENGGNVHIRPRGNIFITNSRNKEVGLLEVNQEMSSLLPSAKKTFDAQWNDGFLVAERVIEEGKEKFDSKGNPEFKVRINWNKLTEFRLGKYKANLIMVYDNGTKDVVIERSTQFWVIPYTLRAILLGVILLILIIIKISVKLYIKRELKKAKNTESKENN